MNKQIAINLCAGFIVAYLCGSFANASLDLKDWDPPARAFTPFFALLLAVMLAAARKW